MEWQLRIAAGEGLPKTQDQITESGHAFESRLYAENPDQNFAPSIGTLTTLRLPYETSRVDSGVEEGQEISPYYDPMIAKIITYAPTRKEALGQMRAALKQTRVAGLETNARFLNALASDPDFIEGDVSTVTLKSTRRRYLTAQRMTPVSSPPRSSIGAARPFLQMQQIHGIHREGSV